MSPELFLLIGVLLTVLGGRVGWLLSEGRHQDCYECLVDCEEELDDAEDLLEDFRVAVIPVVRKLEKVGDETDWESGPETFCTFEWHEVEPLAKCLERQKKREEDITKGESHDKG